ncbi:MAG TPA: AMP-binding protein, partial [Acidimicrobiales bacterium]|nr:AMP-binding protein [Acidimicrobiales bacterium]
MSTASHPWVHAESQPDAPAVIMDDGTTVSYEQLRDRSNRGARFLRARGLAPGDHIAIFMDNAPGFFEVAWAAQSAGLYYTPINRHLRPAEVEYILEDCGARAVVVSRDLAEVAAEVSGGCPLRVSIGGAAAGFESWEEQLAAQPADPFEDAREGREM